MRHLRMTALAAAAAALLAAPLLTAQGSGGPGGGGGGWGGSGGRGGGGGGEETTLGNNLSVPVVFAEGYSLLGLPTSVVPGENGLRPFPGQPAYPALEYWDSTTLVQKDAIFYYPQQSNSHWQADWLNGVGEEQVIVDWGDNLTHQEWTARSVIRVENVLYRDDLGLSLLTYPMVYLFGEGASEIQGTTGTPGFGAYRTVYSVTPRLTFEKLVAQGGPVDTTVEPFSAAVYERYGYDGPGGYGAEVNVAGKVIFGYNWMLSQVDLPFAQKAGWWRLTFSLDPVASYTITAEDGTSQSFVVNRNVKLSALDPLDLLEEVMFKPTLALDGYSTVLEINVVEKRTGKKPDNPGRGGGANK